MSWRSFTSVVLGACVVGLSNCPAAETKNSADPSVQYMAMDAPAGSSRAVVVQGVPLVHTRQLLPEDRDGKIVGEGSVDKQIEQLLANIDAVLTDAGSSMSKLVRLNVHALSPATVSRFQQMLAKRLDPSVRPAITSILTAMPHRGALVAADALAAGSDKGPAVVRQRCKAVGGDKDCADAAVMPRGGVAYFSGRPDEGGLTTSAVTKSMTALMKMLEQVKLSPTDVVQLKVFLKPASAADDVMGELKKFFPGQMVPPVLFIEWLTTIPVEIEMVARLPADKKAASSLVHYNPPDCVSFPSFSRIALVYTDRQIYIGGLFGEGKGEEEGLDLFAKLGNVLSKAGSDVQHMAKASYYATDDLSARFFDKARSKFLDPRCPPAASKVNVHGVGQAGRTMTLDMIAVGK
jgi:enamine deaminase RidA (YjgF/YER057c/UK114 family)